MTATGPTSAERAIDAYLNEMSWAMGGSLAEQQAARDELRAHIAEAAHDHELQGLSPDDALVAALRELGAPEDVGISMRASRGTTPLRKPLVQPEGALILNSHRVRNLPPFALLLAFGALAVAAIVAAFAFVWPL